jgi:tetratricopeptide (TPR) repeat protein
MVVIGSGQQAETHGNFGNAVNVRGNGNTVNIEAPALDYDALAKALLEQSRLALGGPAADLGATIAKVAAGAAAGDERLEQALQLLQAKKPEQAEPLLLSVAEEKASRIERDSKDAAEAYRGLAAIASVSDPGRAQEAYEKALSYDPDDLGSALQAAWIAMGSGQMQHAADLFRLVQEKSSSGVQLFWTHLGFADFYEWRGDVAHAVGACVEAVKLAQAIRAKFPDDLGARRKLRVALGRYGDAVKRRGDKDAVDWYLRALALFDSTAVDAVRSELENSDFALLLNKIGQVWLEGGNEAGALDAHNAALKIWSDLAAAEPKSVHYRRNVMITRDHLGNLYAKMGDWQGASGQYQAAIQIAAELASADRENKEAERDLGNLDIKVGDVFLREGMTEQALEAFRAGLSFVKRVAAGEAENCEYQEDVVRAQVKVGQAAVRLGLVEEAKTAFEEGVRVAKGLAARNAKNAGWGALLRAAEEGLEGLSS